MEFLDDVLQRQEPEEQTEETYEAASDAPIGDPWQVLMAGVTVQEPVAVEEKTSRRRSHKRRGLSRGQRVVLGALGVFVVVVWIAIVAVVARSHLAQATDAHSEPAPEAALSPAASPDEAVDAAPDTAAAGAPNDAVPERDAPPTAVPPVFTVYDRQIESDPNNPDLYVQRGREYVALGAYEAAVDDFEHAQQLNSQRPEIFSGLGWARYYLGQWAAAEAAFTQAVNSGADLADAYQGLGQLTYYQGRYRDAAQAFDAAAELDRSSAAAEAWLAIAAARVGDREEAKGAVERAQSIDDGLAIVYVAQSWSRRTQSPPDIDGIQGDLLYARDLEPNSFLPLNALASFYLDYRPERLSEAEQLAVYARNWAEDNVERAVALQTLGRIYLQQQRTDEARAALTEADTLLDGNGHALLPGLADDLARAGE